MYIKFLPILFFWVVMPCLAEDNTTSLSYTNFENIVKSAVINENLDFVAEDSKTLPNGNSFWVFAETVKDDDKEGIFEYLFTIVFVDKNGEILAKFNKQKLYTAYLQDIFIVRDTTFPIGNNLEVVAFRAHFGVYARGKSEERFGRNQFDKISLYVLKDGELHEVMDDLNSATEFTTYDYEKCTGYLLVSQSVLHVFETKTDGYNDLILNTEEIKTSLNGHKDNDHKEKFKCETSRQLKKKSVILEYRDGTYKQKINRESPLYFYKQADSTEIISAIVKIKSWLYESFSSETKTRKYLIAGDHVMVDKIENNWCRVSYTDGKKPLTMWMLCDALEVTNNKVRENK